MSAWAWEEYEDWLQTGSSGIFKNDGDVLCLECGNDYMSAHSFLNASSYLLKMGALKKIIFRSYQKSLSMVSLRILKLQNIYSLIVAVKKIAPIY